MASLSGRLERVLVHGGFLYLVLEMMVSSMREHFRSYSNKYQDPQMIKVGVSFT